MSLINKIMEKINIHINRLGRIKDSDITIDQLMLFCGASGMGKSYVTMLSHYFFYVWLNPKRINQFMIDHDFDYDKMRSYMNNSGRALEIQKSDLEQWLAQDAIKFLKYLLGNESLNANISVKLPATVPEIIAFDYEETIEGIVNSEEVYVILHSDHLKYRVKEKGINEESPFAVLLRSEMMHCIFGEYQALRNYFILPPSRGALLTEKVTPQSGLYKKFDESLSILRTLNVIEDNVSNQASDMLVSLMDGKIGQDKDLSFYYENDDVHIPLSAAASSIREIGVLQLLLEKTSLANDAILFEEPEAHLHPMKQRLMADVIARFFKAGAYMQITTHSDYFLHRFNELLQLGKLKRKLDSGKYANICGDMDEDTEAAIDYDGIQAYLVDGIEGGYSRIKPMKLDDGIPFTTFREAIMLSLNKEHQLNTLLENENN